MKTWLVTLMLGLGVVAASASGADPVTQASGAPQTRTKADGDAQPGAEQGGGMKNSFRCTLGKQERKIYVNYAESGKSVPCDVVYVKSPGEQKTLWTAKTAEGYCEKQAEDFASRLGQQGWRCAVEK